VVALFNRGKEEYHDFFFSIWMMEVWTIMIKMQHDQVKHDVLTTIARAGPLAGVIDAIIIKNQ
jgi:hypothetical protein